VKSALMSRRSAGRAMIAIGVFGFVSAVLGAVFAWQATGRVESTLDESLDVTVETLDVVADTVDVANEVVETVAGAMATTDQTLSDVSTAFVTASDLFGQLSTVTGELPAQLDEVEAGVARVASVADTIDDVVGLLNGIPLAPDLPAVGLGDAVRQVLDGITPVADDVGALSGDLGEAADVTETLEADLVRLQGELAATTQTLNEASNLVDEFSLSAVRASALAVDAQGDVGRDLSSLRWLIVFLGAAIALGQFVPIWIGAQLLRRPLPGQATDPPL
jgi:methyl-accepting chemotaxis protein